LSSYVASALAEYVQQLQDEMASTGRPEPIHIVAFSNGTTIAHLAQTLYGMRPTDITLMGSPLSKPQLAASASGLVIENYGSSHDHIALAAATLNGGYAAGYLPPGYPQPSPGIANVSQHNVNEMYHTSTLAQATQIKPAPPKPGYVSYYFGHQYLGSQLQFTSLECQYYKPEYVIHDSGVTRPPKPITQSEAFWMGFWNGFGR